MVAAANLPRLEPEPLIALSQVSKEYDTGGGLVRAMRDVSLSIAQGEFVAIVGASGSGKSTMMNILGCLDRPTRGTYTLAGLDVGSRAGDSRAIVRNRVIGFIFQGFNLLSRTTALENVELPLQYRGVGARERRRLARGALAAVGLGDRVDHSPSQLSGGQQQRVAIARALVTNPPLLLADEPTGNLDTRTSLEVLALLQNLNRERGITIVLVTHERDIAACASRVVTMRDGQIVSDLTQERPLDAAAELASLPPGEVAEDEGSAGRRPGVTGGEANEAPAGRPVPSGVFAVMLLGGLATAGVVEVYLRVGFGWSPPWGLVAIAGEVVAAYAGSRWLRRRQGAPLSNDQRLRVTVWYGAVFLVVSALLLTVGAYVPALARKASLDPVLDAVEDLSLHRPLLLAANVGASLLSVALLRYLLLTLFNAHPRERR
jgi:putative ABC transport system ATP-binding protein